MAAAGRVRGRRIRMSGPEGALFHGPTVSRRRGQGSACRRPVEYRHE
ncbi:hypothetical protein J2X01_004235 [Arthrobacter ginsengisoli]|uniref:Uncharacterized protein n=1 Tax=Arthrobacter ginsengisoli TaxID=1356565 RepID=A0ABU1UI89_9MICC|nr:hypothetical protein [Arthrobacter ginsengisoli]